MLAWKPRMKSFYDGLHAKMQVEKEQAKRSRRETFLKQREEAARQIRQDIMSKEAEKIKQDLK